MCHLEIHHPTDQVDLTDGGILLRGGLSKIDQDIKDVYKELSKVNEDEFREDNVTASKSDD
jgi:hypothetical protein